MKNRCAKRSFCQVSQLLLSLIEAPKDGFSILLLVSVPGKSPRPLLRSHVIRELPQAINRIISLCMTSVVRVYDLCVEGHASTAFSPLSRGQDQRKDNLFDLPC